MDHDFEDIEVKENAIELLEKTLKNKRKKCMIGNGSMTDPYIPLELELENVRKSMFLAEKYGFGYTLITKSNRVLRDLDIIKRINEKTKFVLQMTLTTSDENICKIVEPGVSTTRERVEVLKIMRDEGIPTIVWFTPFLPFINDTEENLIQLLDYCIEAKVKGIIFFGIGLTLREGNREYFYEKLDKYFPGLKEQYIRMYGNAYELNSPNSEKLSKIFYKKCRENSIMCSVQEIFSYLSEFEEREEQLTLF